MWNRIPLSLNDSLYRLYHIQDCLCVNACITRTLSNKYTNIFESSSNIEADRALFLWWSVVEEAGLW